MPVLAQIIKNFQAYHPDVMFDVMYIPQETLFERFSSDSREGIGPTLLLAPADWGPALYKEELISEITADIEKNILATLNQPAVQASNLDGKLIGLPYAIEGAVLFRNKDIVTIKPESFDDLVSLAQTSTQSDVIGAYLDRSFYYSGAHLIGIGGQLIDQNQLPGFNNGKGVEWLEMLKAFEQAGPTCYLSDDDLERFKSGKVGWIIDGTWNISMLVDSIGADKLAIDPWPDYQEGQLSGFVTAENVFLSAQTNPGDRRAALAFMEFMVSPESQTLLAEQNRVPSIISISSSDPSRGNLVGQAAAALAGGTPFPNDPLISNYGQSLDLALRSFFEQGLPADQVLQNAQDAILAQSAQATPSMQP